VEKDYVKRKIKFEYYRVVCTDKNGPRDQKDRLFDLRLWIQKAGKKSLEARTFDYRQERARLEEAGFDQDVNHWYLHFSRLRDSLLPSKAKRTSKVEPFTLEEDEYLGEEVTALYDEDSYIFMVQRNRYSLGHSGLEEYLNLLWDGENNLDIHLRPIFATDTVERAKRGDQYRRITVRFADLDTKVYKGEKETAIKRLINEMIGYGAINGEVTLTMGYNKDKSLDSATVSDTIDDIVRNKGGIISKAEVAIKNDDSAVEIIDLFDEVAHDYEYFEIPRRSTLLHESIFAEMGNIYKESRKRILGYLKK
jgi:hypothetical protein